MQLTDEDMKDWPSGLRVAVLMAQRDVRERKCWPCTQLRTFHSCASYFSWSACGRMSAEKVWLPVTSHTVLAQLSPTAGGEAPFHSIHCLLTSAGNLLVLQPPFCWLLSAVDWVKSLTSPPSKAAEDRGPLVEGAADIVFQEAPSTLSAANASDLQFLAEQPTAQRPVHLRAKRQPHQG
jgi:hypothetical protein